MKHYKRLIFKDIFKRLQEPRRFIQVLAGPRQVGKTTLATQLIEAMSIPTYYASADEPTLKDLVWIESQWQIARTKGSGKEILLILDEIQKIPNWSETIKRLWDEDTRKSLPIKVMILGSSPLLIQQGLTESLAGRFEVIHISHWSFSEMQAAFSWDINQYIYFGGYPGAVPLIVEEDRWKRYIRDALIETTISRDILLMTRINKPALLRRLFQLGCDYSGQILSFQKMLGQLQDAGNTTTLAHYLDLLSQVGMIKGLPKYTGTSLSKRASSPKLQAFNTGLISATQDQTFKQAQEAHDLWGRLVESSVGAHLMNATLGTSIKVYYWRERNQEVDFVLQKGSDLISIEVKSQGRSVRLSGLQAFSEKFHPKAVLLVGENGISLETFFQRPIDSWFD